MRSLSATSKRRNFQRSSASFLGIGGMPGMGTNFCSAVEAELSRARHDRIGCAELGDWAIAADYRPLRLLWRFSSAPMSRRNWLGNACARQPRPCAITRRAHSLPHRWEFIHLWDRGTAQVLRFAVRLFDRVVALRFSRTAAAFSPLLREMRAKFAMDSALCALPAATLPKKYSLSGQTQAGVYLFRSLPLLRESGGVTTG